MKRAWQPGYPQRFEASNPTIGTAAQYIGLRNDGQMFYVNVDGKSDALVRLNTYLDKRCECSTKPRRVKMCPIHEEVR
jgi:hypothetical protein